LWGVRFLWWWLWRLLSCTMVIPCSLVMCEYSVSLILCLWLQQLYRTESLRLMGHPVVAVVLMAVLKEPLQLSGDTFHKTRFSSPQHWDWLCNSQPSVINMEFSPVVAVGPLFSFSQTGDCLPTHLWRSGISRSVKCCREGGGRWKLICLCTVHLLLRLIHMYHAIPMLRSCRSPTMPCH
jgi:hypothetical protein